MVRSNPLGAEAEPLPIWVANPNELPVTGVIPIGKGLLSPQQGVRPAELYVSGQEVDPSNPGSLGVIAMAFAAARDMP